MTRLRVLALQPYFGGSHAQFHNGWTSMSSHKWTTLELPPRHWKWRMRHAAIHFVSEINRLIDQGETWDVIVATDMMNIAEFKGLMHPGLRDIPIVLYFHENQFVYPNQWGPERDRHFPFTNFVSAIAADELWFNSQFNLDSMIDSLQQSVKRWPDFEPVEQIEPIRFKSKIQPPGIETPPIEVKRFQEEKATRAKSGEPIRIVWAARWEHDKNPEALFEALQSIDKASIPFQISVIGQTFRRVPPIFDRIKTEFADKILRWGFQESRDEYWKALAESDLFVSTANHEFFGLSAAEAIAAGTSPVLPNRLAYPELLAYSMKKQEVDSSLYEDSTTGLAKALIQIAEDRVRKDWPINVEASSALLNKLALSVRVPELDEALVNAVRLDQSG